MPNRILEYLVARFLSVADVFTSMAEWSGVFFAVIIALGAGGLLIVIPQLSWQDQTRLERTIWIAVGSMWLLLDVPYLYRIVAVARRGQRPVALHVAIGQHSVPAILRPIVSVWWLAHFAFGLMGAVVSHGLKPELGSCSAIFTFFLVACYGFAANGFLMMGVCAVSSSEPIRLSVWRFRSLLDLGLALLSLALQAKRG